jgi:uncharacterized membrane protein HdeD (DUF308 family)
MGTVVEPRAMRDLDRAAGWILLGASAFLIWGVLLYGAGEEDAKIVVIAVGLAVTLLGLVVFEEALRQRGEWLLSLIGCFAFAIGSTFWITRDIVGQSTGLYVFGFERNYTLLACLTIALFGWSILRTRAVPIAVGWLAIAWGIVDGFLYVARIFNPPLGPNLAILIFGLALVWSGRDRAPVGSSRQD